jgi:hypothetical protein
MDQMPGGTMERTLEDQWKEYFKEVNGMHGRMLLAQAVFVAFIVIFVTLRPNDISTFEISVFVLKFGASALTCFFTYFLTTPESLSEVLSEDLDFDPWTLEDQLLELKYSPDYPDPDVLARLPAPWKTTLRNWV